MTMKVIRASAFVFCVCIFARADTELVSLKDIESGLTSPAGNYRWCDAADNLYSESYRKSYNYTQAEVIITYDTPCRILRGTLVATNLKPNFAYQLKLVGTAGAPDNERIGLAGRWWQEEWDGTKWANGWNLNDKGNGYSPTPNDTTYFARRDIAEPTSQTGKRYKYTAYLVMDYFITDSNGNATLSFKADSSYHVLWKSTQRTRDQKDGPPRIGIFNPDTSQAAYDVDYPQTTIGIFGEWERLPVGRIKLMPGQYNCQIMLTEESFHGSGGQYAGGWAAAMGTDISFKCVSELRPRLENPALADGIVLFDVVDCDVGATNYVERSFNLGQTNGWETVSSFVSSSSATNWTESISPDAEAVFYRVKSIQLE